MNANNAAVSFYNTKAWSDFESILETFAGKVALSGCDDSRLHVIEAVYSVIESRSGEVGSDNDTDRYYRRNLLPLARILLAQARKAHGVTV